MKIKLITLSIVGAVALAGAALQVQAGEGMGGRHGHGGHGKGGHKMRFGLEQMTKDLDLTPQQQAQVAPIIDQAKPQLKAIHEEAMQKTRALMEASTAQIRPILTPEQQQKLDNLKAAHEKMHEAMKELHAAKAD